MAANWKPVEQILVRGWDSAQNIDIKSIGLDGIVHFFKTEDPLLSVLAIALAFATWCWIFAELTRNCSQVDRLWSIVPAIYVLHFAYHGGWDARLVLMLGLVALWSIRLTYNFVRKGGSNLSSEDYRWPELRKRMPRIAFAIFNLTFIAFYQNLLLLLITLPAYVAYRAKGTPLNALDGIAVALFVILLVGETVADQQQWNFQTEKYRLIGEKKPLKGDYAVGFLRRGLFAYSRHPNFFCEISLWFSFYLFSVAATGVYLNWSIVGVVLLLLLFQGSTWFTEYLSLLKYPVYADYQKTTSKLIPWPSSAPKKRD